MYHFSKRKWSSLKLSFMWLNQNYKNSNWSKRQLNQNSPSCWSATVRFLNSSFFWRFQNEKMNSTKNWHWWFIKNDKKHTCKDFENRKSFLSFLSLFYKLQKKNLLWRNFEVSKSWVSCIQKHFTHFLLLSNFLWTSKI